MLVVATSICGMQWPQLVAGHFKKGLITFFDFQNEKITTRVI